MPYLRLHSVELPLEQKREIARQLTARVLQILPDQKQDWCTVHFQSFGPDDLAIGGQLVSDGRTPDYHLEFSFPSLPNSKKRELVNELMPLLARELGLRPNELSRINVMFREYDPQDFAVGGKFLNEIISPSAYKAS